MKMFFIQEAVYLEYQGKYYSNRIKYETYWERYLSHFEMVNVFARVKKVKELPLNFHVSSGENVKFIPINYYNGTIGFLKNRRAIKNKIRATIERDAAYVLRIPGLLGEMLAKELKKNNIKYSVEVVGDPYEVADFLRLPYLLRICYKFISLYQMKRMVYDSIGALYVTQYTLQKKIPSKKG